MKNQSNTKFTLALLPLLLLSSYPPLTFAASEFVKDTKTGCKVYADLDDANESATWSGVCVDGKISGKGKLTTINKKTNVTCEHNGEWKAGFIAGHNIIDCSNGFHFEGDNTPAGGVAKGNGTFIFPNGHKYVGEFKSRTLHGQGTYTDASGNSMSGTFENNKLVKLDTSADSAANNNTVTDKELATIKSMPAVLKNALALFQQAQYAETIVELDKYQSLNKQLPENERKNSTKMHEMLSKTYAMKAVAYSKLGKLDEFAVTYHDFNQLFADSTNPKIQADAEAIKGLVTATALASRANNPDAAREAFGKCNQQDVQTWEGHACYVATESIYGGSKNPEVQAIVRKNHAIAQAYEGKDEAAKYKKASGKYASSTQSDAACIEGGSGGIFNALFEGGGVIWFTSIDGAPAHDKKVCVPPGEHTVCFSSGGSFTGVDRGEVCTKGNFAASKKYKLKSTTGARTQNENSRTNGAYETHDQVTYEKFDYMIEEVK
jgi:hypothetical protein